MERPKVDKTFLNALKLVRKGLKLGWDKKFERFFIAHTQEYTGLERVICYIEDEEGEFRMPDVRDLNYVQRKVAWDVIDKYPTPREMWAAWRDAKDTEKKKKLAKRRQFIRDFIRDNKQRVRKAMEELQEGVPIIREHKKKIVSDIGSVTKGFNQAGNGLFMPIMSKGE